MGANVIKSRQLLIVVICVALAAAGATPATAGGHGHGSDDRPTVLPPDSRILGRTYGEWNAKWWKWLFETPFHESPVFSGGPGAPNAYQPVDCSAGQRGRVWFLGGTFLPTGSTDDSANSDVYRSCDVAAGTYLYLPMINSEADNLLCPKNTTYSAKELIALATGSIDRVPPDSLTAEIDGVPVTGLAKYRSPSRWFSYRLPGDNLGQLPDVCGKSFRRGTMPPPVDHHGGAIADGYYLMVAPLSPGEHSLKFGGKAYFPQEDGSVFVFTQNVNYEITVKCRGHHQRWSSNCGHR